MRLYTSIILVLLVCLIICLIISTGIVSAQTNIINVVIVDSATGNPIEKVEAKNLSTNQVYYSNQDGKVKIESADHSWITLYHMSYTPLKIKGLNLNNNDTVKLTMFGYTLTAIEFQQPKPREFLKKRNYYITDYEFIDDKIILLAYENNSYAKPLLLLADYTGDTISVSSISKPFGLTRDYCDNTVLLTKGAAFKVKVNSGNISLYDPEELSQYYTLNDLIEAQNDSMFYIRKCSLNNQQIDFYCYNSMTENWLNFKTIFDKENYSRNMMGLYFDGKEEDIRFQQLIMMKPLYAPLVLYHDTIRIFNFNESRIETFDAETNFICSTGLDFKKSKNFKNQIITDKITGKNYLLFVENGISILNEIEVETGKLVKHVKIPDFVYIEKIQVHNNVLYFLYKEKNHKEYKRLFTMAI